MVSTPNFTDGTWNVVSTVHVDGDPNGDILWQNINDQSMVLWQQDGATTTSITELPSLDNFDALVVGDFDGDGKADQFLRRSATGADKILLSSTGTIGNTVTVANPDWSFRAASDFSGDGKDDIFSFFNSTGLLQTWEMNGTIVTSTKFLASGYGSGDLLHAVFGGTSFSTFDSLWFDDSVGDYNITSYDSGVRTITDTFSVDSGNEYAGTHDFNGDGGSDFLFIDRAGNDRGDAEIIFSNDVNETARLNWQVFDFPNYHAVAGGDFDNDGNAELMLRHGVSGDLMTVNAIGGSSLSESIFGSDGSDIIDGQGGIDRIFGQGGDDFLIGGAGDDTIRGGDGNDRIVGGDDEDILSGNAGDDHIEGDTGNDFINGGTGNDTLYAGNGTDFLFGEAGDDFLVGGAVGFDHLKGGLGDDFLRAGTANSILDGEEGDDIIYGGNGDNYLYGGSGDDFLVGGFNNDTIWGGSGNDIIVGTDLDGLSGVTDTMYGGSGADFFVLGNDDTSYYTVGGNARIEDFTSSDFLVLNGVVGDYTVSQVASDVEIRLGGDLVADVINSNVSTVGDNMIFIA